MSLPCPESCNHCTSTSSPCDHLLPCSTCISADEPCTYPRPSTSLWADLPPSRIQQWSEHPRLTRGGFGGARLKPLRNEKGEIEEFEWEQLVQQDQDLRIKPTKSRSLRLCPPTINLSSESEHLDLIGDPLSFSNDSKLFSSLSSVLPEIPLHPTIYLNAHLASNPPLKKSRIASSFEPSNPNRGNCVASVPIRGRGGEKDGQAVVWRMGDGTTKRPTAVGFGTFSLWKRGNKSKASRKGKERAIDQDEPMTIEPQDKGGFQVYPSPIFTHHTPIHQLSLLSLPSTSSTSASSFLVGVRSHTSLDLINLSLPLPFDPGKQQPNGSRLLSSSPSIVSHYSYSITRSTMSDFTLGGIVKGYGEIGQGLVVDIEGNLFGFGLTDFQEGGGGRGIPFSSRPPLYQLRKSPNSRQYSSRNEYSGFSRVAYSGGGGGGSSNNARGQAIVAMEDQVLLYDLRSSKDRLELLGQESLKRHLPFGSNHEPSVVASLLERSPTSEEEEEEGVGGRNPWIHTVCTTRDVVWVDMRMVGNGNGNGRDAEVLRWSHDRVGIEGKGFDRTLMITEVPDLSSRRYSIPTTTNESVQRIALTSRLNPNVTIYTTGLNPTSAPRSLLDPYDLPSPSPFVYRSTTVDPDGGKFRRVGLSMMERFEPDDEEEDEAVEEGDGVTEMELELEDGGLDEEGKRRKRFLEKMVKQAEREERERGKVRTWRFLDLGMDGELFEREVGLAKAIEVGGTEELKEAAGAVEEGRIRERLESGMEIETTRLDMTAAKKAVSAEQLVAKVEREEREELGLQGDSEAVEMLKKAVEEAGEIEGDVGALTALELLDFGRSAARIPTPAPETDSDDDEEQEGQGDSRMVDRGPTTTSRIETLPRPSAFIPSRETPLLDPRHARQFSLLESLVSSLTTSAAASLRPFEASPTSRFNVFAPFPFSLQGSISDRADHLRRMYNIQRSDSPASLACDRVAIDLSLSSHILLPRAIVPDEPTDSPNQPQPASEEPPALHLSYLRPIVSDEPDDSDGYDSDGPASFRSRNGRGGRKKKPTLNGRGTRMLLAEWHIGSDPRSYVWSNPYAGEKEKDDPYSQYSQSQSQSQRSKKGKKKQKNGGESSSQPPIPSFSQSRFEFPSSFPPSSSQSYFPSLGVPPTLQVVSEEVPASSSQGQSQSQTVGAATQPVISVTGPPEGARQYFGGANSQVVPGVFGSRNNFGAAGAAGAKAKDKKKAKKRVSGF